MKIIEVTDETYRELKHIGVPFLDRENEDYPTNINPNILVPNWYTKEHLENIVGQGLNKLEFEEFKEYLLNSTDIPDLVSSMVEEELVDWLAHKMRTRE